MTPLCSIYEDPELIRLLRTVDKENLIRDIQNIEKYNYDDDNEIVERCCCECGDYFEGTMQDDG